MSQFIESIRIKDQKASNLSWHKKRVKSTFDRFFPEALVLDIESIIQQNQIEVQGLFKCRIVYDNKSHMVEFEPYLKKEIKTIVCVHDDEVNYSYKYADRAHLKSIFEKKGNADDVLIIKKGLVTDCHYANVAFLKNENWYTPKDPLLAGTQRAKLIEEKRVSLLNIKSNEINNFEKMALFNAMIPFEERIEINIDAISNC